MNLIIEGKHYELSDDNIRIIIPYINPELYQIYETSSYTTIINTKKIDFIKYINNYLGDCIENVFPDTSIFEDESTIIGILHNENIEDDIKTKYLSKQSNKVNLHEVKTIFWDIAIDSNIINPTWKNIEKYISVNVNNNLNPTIVNFISRNSHELSQQKIKGIISDTTDNRLFLELMGSNLLPIEDYEQIGKSFDQSFISTDLSSLESNRMETLITTQGVEFNEYNYELVNEHFPELSLSFTLQNKSVFLSDLTSYPLSSNIANSLLNKKELSLKEKLQIIQTLFLTMLQDNSTLSDSVCTVLNSSSKIPVNNVFILEITSVPLKLGRY